MSLLNYFKLNFIPNSKLVFHNIYIYLTGNIITFLIKTYTIIEIVCKYVFNVINFTVIDEFKTITGIDDDNFSPQKWGLSIIKNGKNMLYVLEDNFEDLITKTNNYIEKLNIINDELVLLKDPDNNILIYNGNYLTKNTLFTKSNIKFLDITLVYDNAEYEIKFHECDYNYYIVGNVIDKYFINYIISSQIKDIINTDLIDYDNVEINNDINKIMVENKTEISYVLEIIDNNAKLVSLNETNKLIINLNDYIIL